MIILGRVDNFEKLTQKYPHGTYLFNLDRSKKVSVESGDEKVDLPQLDILPAAEDIDAFLSKDMSAKKVIRRFLKRVTNVRAEGDQLPVTVFMLVRMITERERKPYGVIGLILPETDNKKLDKLYKEALRQLFKQFGLKALPKLSKDAKKLLKGKRKKVKKALSQYIAENVYLSEKGEKLYKKLKDAYKIEIASASLETILENDGKIKKNMIENIRERVIKSLDKSKDKKMAKMYKEFYEELEPVAEIIGGLPNMKKIKKLKKVAAIVVLRHLAARRFGVEIGSKDYNRYMSLVTKQFGFDKEFNEAMKKSS